MTTHLVSELLFSPFIKIRYPLYLNFKKKYVNIFHFNGDPRGILVSILLRFRYQHVDGWFWRNFFFLASLILEKNSGKSLITKTLGIYLRPNFRSVRSLVSILQIKTCFFNQKLPIFILFNIPFVYFYS